MYQQLNPYLSFDGNCDEAMAFYGEVLGGTVRGMSFRDTGMDIDGIMHAALETPTGFHLYGSDRPKEMGELVQGNALQISLSGDDAEALTRYFEGLSDGGQVLMPLARQMWGDDYGMLIDKYGFIWHVNIVVASQG